MKRFVRLIFLQLLALLARGFVRRTPAAVSSILYIKPDHLGDLLLATPALAALRQRFPAAQISALVGPWSQVVLARNPDIDQLLTCPFPGFARQATVLESSGRYHQDTKTPMYLYHPWRFGILMMNKLGRLAQPYLLLVRYALLLRAGRYDLAVIGRDDHWWGAALALLAGIPWRAGFGVPECRPFLSLALAWEPGAHVTMQGLALVDAVSAGTAAHADRAAWATRFDPSADDHAWAAQWARDTLGEHERLVILHPGTGGPTKLWIADRWGQVLDALAQPGTQLLLTGGPDERALVAAITARTQTTVLSLAGETSFGQLAALFRRAALVLGVDSGPLHLAAVQHVPTLHLYGPGDDRRFGPWGDPARHVVLRAPLHCSPCGEFRACPRGLAQPECMELLQVGPVVAQARALLAGSAPTPGD